MNHFSNGDELFAVLGEVHKRGIEKLPEAELDVKKISTLLSHSLLLFYKANHNSIWRQKNLTFHFGKPGIS